MSATGSLRLRPRFTGLDALVPRVTELGVTSSATVFEPRPSVTATTALARFRDGTAFVAHGTADRLRRGR